MFRLSRFIALAARWRWLVFVLLALASAFAATRLPGLEVRLDADAMFSRDDATWLDYQVLTQRYGDDQLSLVVVQDEDLFRAEVLQRLKGMQSDLEALPFVSKVDSLFSVPRLRFVEGYLQYQAYLDPIPTTADGLKDVLKAVDNNRFVSKILLSPDHKSLAFAVHIDPNSDWSERQQQQALADQTQPLRALVQRAFHFSAAQIRLDIADAVLTEQLRLLPWAVLALLLALFLLLRQLLDILLPLLTASLSILWVLAAMAWLNIPLNIVTSIVPVLLIIIGSTEDIHLISEFRHAQREGLDRDQAIGRMAQRMGRTVFLTITTTLLGFASVALSDIEMLRQFGMVSALGLAMNFVITIALVPAALRVGGDWRLDGAKGLYSHRALDRAKRYWRVLRASRWLVVAAALAVVGAGLWGASAIRVNHDPVASLPEDARARDQLARVNAAFAGTESLSIVLDSGIADTFLKIRYLDEVRAIQRFVEGESDDGEGRVWAKASTSFADYLALVNAAFEEYDEPLMPDADSTIAELMLFVSHQRVAAYVSEDFSQVRIVVHHQISDTEGLEAFVAALRDYLDQHLDTGLSYQLNGNSLLSLSASQALLKGQAESVLGMGLIVLVLIALLFAQWRVGILAVAPNLLPVVVILGVMGYAGIALNIGTTMAVAIAIGLAVDDSLHFMLRYNQELKIARNEQRAMESTLASEALPVVSTSLAMMGGFLVFYGSDFPPIRDFGLLAAIAIATALVADLVMTPLLVASTRLVTLWDLLSTHIRQDILRRSLLFKGLNERQIRRFLASSRLRGLNKGELLFRQGEPAKAMFLLMSGRVDAVLPGCDGGQQRVIERFSAGDLIGDVAVHARSPRKTDAIARGTSHVVEISEQTLQTFIREHPQIAARIQQNISTALARRLITMVERQNAACIDSKKA